MLGFNHLGRMGQLGNQMFKYASLKGIARNRGFDYMVANNEDVVVDSLGNKLYTELFNPFNIDVQQCVLDPQQYVQEPHFQFSEELFNTCPDNASLIVMILYVSNEISSTDMKSNSIFCLTHHILTGF